MVFSRVGLVPFTGGPFWRGDTCFGTGIEKGAHPLDALCSGNLVHSIKHSPQPGKWGGKLTFFSRNSVSIVRRARTFLWTRRSRVLPETWEGRRAIPAQLSVGGSRNGSRWAKRLRAAI